MNTHSDKGEGYYGLNGAKKATFNMPEDATTIDKIALQACNVENLGRVEIKSFYLIDKNGNKVETTYEMPVGWAMDVLTPITEATMNFWDAGQWRFGTLNGATGMKLPVTLIVKADELKNGFQLNVGTTGEGGNRHVYRPWGDGSLSIFKTTIEAAEDGEAIQSIDVQQYLADNAVAITHLSAIAVEGTLAGIVAAPGAANGVMAESTDALVSAGWSIRFELERKRNRGRNRLQLHHPLHLQILVALGAVGGEIDGGIVLDESADAVEGLAGCSLILKDDGELIGLQGSIAVGDVTVEHVVETIVLQDDNAVALGVTLCLDEVEAGGNFLAGREVLVASVLIADANDIFAFKLHSIGILRRDIHLGVGELGDAVGVVAVLVGDEDLRHLLRLVAQCSERCHIVIHLVAHVERCAQLLGRNRHSGLEACVDEDDAFVSLDEEVLQRTAIDDLLVEHVLAFLAAKGKRLVHEAMVKHAHGLNCFDSHNSYFILLLVQIFLSYACSGGSAMCRAVPQRKCREGCSAWDRPFRGRKCICRGI